MCKKALLILFAFALSTGILSAQTGKVNGRVTDAQTGEPLIGANIIVEGESRGSASDFNGDFVILNVPIGKRTLVASYIGYKKITITDVLVKSNETTTKNIQLPTDAFEVDEVIIVAERPLVDKNVTNSKSTVTQEEIENLPVRGIESIIQLQAGVVSQGGLHVRGSRADATGYYIDGVPANDPMFRGRALSVINNAIAEINFQAGGYSAEYGGANAGLVSTTTRTGGQKMRYEVEAYTDHWAGVGEKSLGTYSTGSSVYILTAGGPLYGPVRFFAAGQNSFSRTPASGWWEPYNLTDKYFPLLKQTEAYELLNPEQKFEDYNNNGIQDTGEPEKVGIFDPRLGPTAEIFDYRFPGGMLLNAASESWTFNGNLTANLRPINLRVGGSYSTSSGRGGAGLFTRVSSERASLSESENYSINGKLTHLLSNNTFYEIYVGFLGNFGVTMDPHHQHDIFAYGDSIKNSALGYTYRADGLLPLTNSVMGTSFVPPGYPLRNGYGKSKFNSITTKINFVHQIGRTHEIKTGAEFSSYSIRSYGVNAFGLKGFLRENPDATALEIAGSSGINFYGYDMWGHELDSGPDGPKQPVFAGVWLLDKIELQDLVLNLGLRYDYIDTKSYEFVDPNNIKFTPEGLIDLQDPENVKDVEASATVSPRVGFSFPVSDQTVFYAQYGKFIQQSRLRDVYKGNADIASEIKGGYAVGSPVGFGLKPERTTQYDFGFRQQIGDNMAFDIGAFYKDIRDQIQQRIIPAAFGAEHQAYYAWVNGDFATTYGATLKIDIRRIKRITMSADYTFQDARGTGSSPSTAFRALWLSPTETPNLPKYAMILDFNREHQGSLNLDYRYGNDDGPSIAGTKVLERLGFNLLFTFQSGRPYTRVNEFSYGDRRTPVEALNDSRTPWIFQLDGRVDKTVTIGPVDVNFYIRVQNLLNIKNETGVYAQSGTSDNNGFLATDEGQNRIANYASYDPIFGELYKDFYYQTNLMNAGVYGAPRRIYIGFRANF